MRAPNFNFERQERDRAKAAKKAEKAQAKAAKREADTPPAENEPEGSSEPRSGSSD